eukprot:scaffold727_cov172-Pinguiococcus_pyrenoidosus.AAC.1
MASRSGDSKKFKGGCKVPKPNEHHAFPAHLEPSPEAYEQNGPSAKAPLSPHDALIRLKSSGFFGFRASKVCGEEHLTKKTEDFRLIETICGFQSQRGMCSQEEEVNAAFAARLKRVPSNEWFVVSQELSVPKRIRYGDATSFRHVKDLGVQVPSWFGRRGGHIEARLLKLGVACKSVLSTSTPQVPLYAFWDPVNGPVAHARRAVRRRDMDLDSPLPAAKRARAGRAKQLKDLCKELAETAVHAQKSAEGHLRSMKQQTSRLRKQRDVAREARQQTEQACQKLTERLLDLENHCTTLKRDARRIEGLRKRAMQADAQTKTALELRALTMQRQRDEALDARRETEKANTRLSENVTQLQRQRDEALDARRQTEKANTRLSENVTQLQRQRDEALDARRQTEKARTRLSRKVAELHTTCKNLRKTHRPAQRSKRQSSSQSLAVDLENKKLGVAGCREAEKRTAIKVYFVEVLGSPPPEEWHGRFGTLATIRKALGLSKGSSQTIQRVVEGVHQATEHGLDFDASSRKRGSGGHNAVFKSVLEPAFQTACQALEAGFSYDMAAAEASAMAGKSIHRRAVKSATERLLGAKSVATPIRQTGSRDESSDWAKARRIFAMELLDQIEGRAFLPELGLESPHQILFVDEHHRKCVIGGLGHEGAASSSQVLIPRDVSGNLCHADHGGCLPEPKRKTVPKFPQEARGCFGVAAPIDRDGNVHAARMEPYNYTGKKILGFTAYVKALEGEIKRVKGLKASGVWGPYLSSPN